MINFRERYSMVEPSVAAEFRPAAEIDLVIEMVASTFVPTKYAGLIKHPLLEDCILRRARRALKNNNSDEFEKSINEYNDLLKKIKSENEQTKLIKDIGSLPQNFVYAMLDQVYSRVVSPEVDELRNYEAFSNNVYGELLPAFMTRIFNLTQIKSTSVFVDLGSGVGNCVLQAALETGCESWGCEMMPHASKLAAKQKAELRQRLKLYGINHGKISLNNQSFVHNDEIQKVLQRVDVLLVNNYAFDGQLNSHLIDMFLDLKDGCKIVSLKSFVPPGHVISEHNIESPLNILEVQRYEFYSSNVSWTDAPGPFYISTVNRSRIQKYLSRRR
ncbi:DOT1-domain-containing protein [Nadsonia fulvescens var. elongata DSM 6958]|uniref:Histone-lysine N-methyltransferase, H3 lysine-79 specific n=1 Tax=Nadsonia fulvescens var. elongata DSM 6958 TaxID=857566 RepID=A0A1E3PI39_9ASCO|nr:DOT1-domain-containing protein [Nadsonia fulvescens var. elongata DSM 6958]